MAHSKRIKEAIERFTPLIEGKTEAEISEMIATDEEAYDEDEQGKILKAVMPAPVEPEKSIRKNVAHIPNGEEQVYVHNNETGLAHLLPVDGATLLVQQQPDKYVITDGKAR